ncbi:hypothetical protein F5Y10DRAFT_270426 [Nemania abortiva]|nr:hypothetical protein F5Y10DRAFT_270426 [Nemania abortiva]
MAALLKWFDHKYKFPVHLVETIVTIVVTALAIAYLKTPGAIVTRIRILIPIVGAKSLVVQAYQWLTEYVTVFTKWRSLKANAILNGLEVLFWSAFIGLLFQANIAKCTGPACGVSWAIFAIGIGLINLLLWVAVSSFLEFRLYRRIGTTNGGSQIPIGQSY